MDIGQDHELGSLGPAAFHPQSHRKRGVAVGRSPLDPEEEPAKQFIIPGTNDGSMIKMRTRAIYENGVLKPLEGIDLLPGEEVDIEIGSPVRRTKGIIKLDPAIARDIADSDECSFLEE